MSSEAKFSRAIDPVLAEVRRIKEEIAAENDFDIDRMIAAARKAQAGYPRRVVSRVAHATASSS